MTADKHPTVAIIMAAHNAERTIARAIKSALAEPEVTEVVVVDDSSTDMTLQIAQSADDGSGRLMIGKQAQNLGPAAARNRALALITADWVGILDGDDFLLPGRTAGLLRYTDQADMVADDMWQVREGGEEAERHRLMGDQLSGPRRVDFPEFVASNVSRNRQRAELGFMKPLIRRSFLQEHHLCYQEQMRLGEDYEFYARALGNGGRLLLVPAQGYVSVVRQNSLSGRHTIDDLRNLRDCDHQLLQDFPLNKRGQRALRRHYLSVDCRLQWRLLIVAVKRKDLVACLRCFLRPWPVPAYLLKQLLCEIPRRLQCERWSRGVSSSSL